MPFMIMCPNEVAGHHRILFYMVFQTTTVNQLGLVPCFSATLLFCAITFMQDSFKRFLALSSVWVCSEAFTEGWKVGQG